MRLVTSTTQILPLVVGGILKDGLQSWLAKYSETRSTIRVIPDDEPSKNLISRRIGKLLRAVFSCPSSDKPVREQLSLQYLVLTHHADVAETGQTSWISLVQGLGVDPAALALDRREEILELLWATLAVPIKVS